MSEYYIEWLRARGFDINDIESRAFNGNTPLLQAALEGNALLVIRLIEAGADIYVVNDDFNGVVFNACYADEPLVIKLLATGGADLNDVNEYGETALMYAVSAGRTRCVKVLMELGSDLSMVNQDGLCAIDFCANREVLDLLRYA